MDSDNINEVETNILAIRLKVLGLNYRKEKAMSLTEFYECSKLIRKERDDLIRSLEQYKKLEQKYELPVRLEYRSALRSLVGKKKR